MSRVQLALDITVATRDDYRPDLPDVLCTRRFLLTVRSRTSVLNVNGLRLQRLSRHFGNAALA